jgi:hypothetical protein
MAKAAWYSARYWQPRTQLQAWLSIAALPLVVVAVVSRFGLGFHTWPQFDGGAAGVTAGYVLLIGTSKSRAVRERRQAQAELAPWE